MKEMVNSKIAAEQDLTKQGISPVDDLLDIYVPSADEKKHVSPTRRLI